MKKTILVFRAVMGLVGVTELVLGVLFWTGHALALVQLHMGLGMLFVLSLWTLAILCGVAGAPIGLVVTTVVWGLLIPALGYSQMQLMPGPNHWIIRVLHLLMVVIGMGLAGVLTRKVETPRVRSGGPVAA